MSIDNMTASLLAEIFRLHGELKRRVDALERVEIPLSSAMSAADILTAIKTVDGSASGLDADLLDGSSSAAFAAASSIGAKVDWTPTATQTVSLTVSASACWYVILGPIAFVFVNVTFGSSGTSGGNIVISAIPSAIAPVDDLTNKPGVGAFSYRRTNTSEDTFYAGTARLNSTTSLVFLDSGAQSDTAPNLGKYPVSFQTTSGDILTATCFWRIA